MKARESRCFCERDTQATRYTEKKGGRERVGGRGRGRGRQIHTYTPGTGPVPLSRGQSIWRPRHRDTRDPRGPNIQSLYDAVVEEEEEEEKE